MTPQSIKLRRLGAGKGWWIWKSVARLLAENILIYLLSKCPSLKYFIRQGSLCFFKKIWSASSCAPCAFLWGNSGLQAGKCWNGSKLEIAVALGRNSSDVSVSCVHVPAVQQHFMGHSTPVFRQKNQNHSILASCHSSAGHKHPRVFLRAWSWLSTASVIQSRWARTASSEPKNEHFSPWKHKVWGAFPCWKASNLLGHGALLNHGIPLNHGVPLNHSVLLNHGTSLLGLNP